jgi:multidrug transporter EmrE-like cation transporter
MDKTTIFKILLSVFGISIGQVFLKFAALEAENQGLLSLKLGKYLSVNAYLLVGAAVLACSTLLWVWVLRTVPLSTAYPFMALAFVLVPALSHFLFNEILTCKHMLGFLLIVAGVVVVSL